MINKLFNFLGLKCNNQDSPVNNTQLVTAKEPVQIINAQSILDEVNNQHYDVAIIGGGSAGLACCIEAKYLGLKPIIFDYVEPSYQGSRWGIGGTCVNVGCIPKKLMHTAALMKETIKNSIDFGWTFQGINDDSNLTLVNKNKSSTNNQDSIMKYFSWSSMVERIQTHIRDLNFSFTIKLDSLNVPYINALATLGDKNTIFYSRDKQDIEHFLKNQKNNNQKNTLRKITADYIVVAVGGRPKYLDNCQGCKEHCITSDDLFSQKNPPKKTLIVGGGYIAVETAGILSSFGYPVTLMTRGKYLKEFDEDCSNEILEFLKSRNQVKIIESSLPFQITKNNNNKLTVKWEQLKVDKNQKISKEQFDTVMMAIGRKPNISLLNLEKVGVKIDYSTGKIKGGYGNEIEQSSISNIYALGDVLHGVPELQPVAAKSGLFLARRINYFKNREQFTQSDYDKTILDYQNCPTTLFTPLEYSACGYSEQAAKAYFGNSCIDVYHTKFIPLEEKLCTRYDENFNNLKKKGYCKIICNNLDNNRIVGIHYVGPNAGEIMQGLSIAMMTQNLNKQLLDKSLGIHPTCAEQFIQMQYLKESGKIPESGPC